MTPAQVLASEIREYCAAHADAKGATRWQRYFKEGYEAWGLLDKNDPLWTQKRPEWSERYAKLGLRGFLKVGEDLFGSGKYEEGALAIQFVKPYREELDASSVEGLRRWFRRGVRNWAHTDVLCGELLAPLLAGGQLGMEAIESWRRSPYKFQRRAVPVALLELAKAGKEIPSLLEFVQPLMTDSERVVQQGLGWFLREAWKKDRRAVERFLLEWKDRAPRLIYQYATEKMPLSDRQRFRAGGAQAGRASGQRQRGAAGAQ